MSSSTEILRGGYEAFARQDIPAVLSLFDPDIDWYSPDELPGGGTYHGPQAVMEFFAAIPTHFDELSVRPQRFLDAGDQVVVQGIHSGSIGGTRFEVGFAHVWTMREGRAVQFREYMDSGKLLPLFAAAAPTTG